MATETLASVHKIDGEYTKPKATKARKAFVAARAFAITVGISVGVGAFIGSVFDSGDESVRNSNASAIEADHKELDQVKENLVVLQQNEGEACIAALKPYIFGGEFANLPPETVINDLLRDPKHPCGDNATKVRSNYTHDATNTNRSLQLYTDLQHLESQTAGYVEDANQSETDAGVRAGLLIGGLVGSAMAVGAIYNADAKLNDFPTTWDILFQDSI